MNKKQKNIDEDEMSRQNRYNNPVDLTIEDANFDNFAVELVEAIKDLKTKLTNLKK